MENLNNKIDQVQTLEEQNLQISAENEELKKLLKDALEKYHSQKKITESVQTVLKRKCAELAEYSDLYKELQEQELQEQNSENN